MEATSSASLAAAGAACVPYTTTVGWLPAMEWRCRPEVLLAAGSAAGAAYPICPLVGLALVMEMENAEDVRGSQPRQRGTLAVQPYTGGLWQG